MNYLERIVTDVRRRLEERMSAIPLHQLRGRRVPEGRASLVSVLREPGISLIPEIKRASPSRGPITPDLDVADIVRRYEEAGAAAISVFTEQDHYRGSLEDLATAVASTSLPVLRKDFVVDEYQLHEARVFGASAVLLIAAILDRDELLALGETALKLGLEPLVEVHDEDQLDRALAVQEAVIDINNRDLESLRVDIESTFRLICRVPPERVVVSESGVRTRDDVLRLEAAGVDGVLVGEHLAQSADVECAIHELLGNG